MKIINNIMEVTGFVIGVSLVETLSGGRPFLNLPTVVVALAMFTVYKIFF